MRARAAGQHPGRDQCQRYELNAEHDPDACAVQVGECEVPYGQQCCQAEEAGKADHPAGFHPGASHSSGGKGLRFLATRGLQLLCGARQALPQGATKRDFMFVQQPLAIRACMVARTVRSAATARFQQCVLAVGQAEHEHSVMQQRQ